MTKELEALDRLYDNLKPNDYFFREDASEDCNLIETALKVLEIIKKKRVNVHILQECSNLEEYNEYSSMNWDDQKETEYYNELLTSEEYDLLREKLL